MPTKTELTDALPSEVTDWMLARYRDEVGERVSDEDHAKMVADRESITATRDKQVSRLLPKWAKAQAKVADLETALADARRASAAVEREVASVKAAAAGQLRRIDTALRGAIDPDVVAFSKWAHDHDVKTRRTPIQSREKMGKAAGFAGFLLPESTSSNSASIERRLAHLRTCSRAATDELPYMNRDDARTRIAELRAALPAIRMERIR